MRATLVAVPEANALGVAVKVQTGGETGGGLTVTDAVAGGLVPDALVAVTEYVYVPATVAAEKEAVTELPVPVTEGAPAGETQL